MAQSIIGGMIKNGWDSEQVIAATPSAETRNKVRDQFGISVFEHNLEATETDAVVICVKPGMVKEVLAELSPALEAKKPLLISVAAGVTMKSLKRWSPGSLAIVRSMPNTPALLGIGASGLFANGNVSEGQKTLTQAIFNAAGISVWVENEALIDAVIAVSGSGPAYYFLFMEAMKQKGIQMGLAADVAEKLTLQTALGAATMALGTDIDIAELRRRVCSPGGTTEQAVRSFLEGGINELVGEAMDSAAARAKQMADELDK